MQALSQEHWTPEEYLAFEAASDEKHELLGGEVYLMTGAKENHNLIVANLLIDLRSTISRSSLQSLPQRYAGRNRRSG